jgi:hypothetical protein
MTLHCLSWFWFFRVFDIKNRTEPKPVGWNRFRFFFVFFQNFGLVVFIDKNRTELKMTTPSSGNLSGPVSIHVKNLLTWAPNPQKTSLFYYSIVFEFLGPTPLVSKLICTKIIALFVYSANHGA